MSDKIMSHNVGDSVINNEIKMPRGGFVVMAVSVKPAPVIKGEAAKKITASYERPVNNSQLIKKFENANKYFVMK